MKRWIIIPRVPGLLVLLMLVLFGLDMAKPGIGQFALIPSLRKSASQSIQTIPKPKIIPTLPAPPTPAAATNEPLQPPPQRANCTAVEVYAGHCQAL
ncbi:hypothetical protein [Laspinema olomoucense]|uniref:Uncharacterized protein n=1 Tax=Laspinema olomoucense D3b TaxID=2953688 RepID=A0ABT2NI97_9CYAN|nr:hypothetical protein [Laspinema sp. D3b]MCT7981450.1 hypothetical protein [Laspinema sp. D3b]